MSRYAKAWVAVSGLVVQLVAAGLIHGTAQTVLTALIAAVTAAGVFSVPNVTVPSVE